MYNNYSAPIENRPLVTDENPTGEKTLDKFDGFKFYLLNFVYNIAV